MFTSPRKQRESAIASSRLRHLTNLVETMAQAGFTQSESSKEFERSQ
jgi:hypothetical protein